MAEPAQMHMTSDEFIAWAMEQPETEHYELIDGEVVATAPEQIGHSRTKAHVGRCLTEAIQADNLPCEPGSEAGSSSITPVKSSSG